jgi:serine/threonine protein kinase
MLKKCIVIFNSYYKAFIIYIVWELHIGKHDHDSFQRDLKPENLLLNENHRILKIADFGTATVFKTAWETSARKTRGIHGSDPYIAPEEWRNQEEYDPSKVDIWACGII